MDHQHASRARAYASALVSLNEAAPSGTPEQRMRLVADTMWQHLGFDAVAGKPHPAERPYSWLGFYTLDEGSDQMVLGPSRNKPACSPIGLHGMCGRSCTQALSVIVDDVRTLGEGYVACDPRDQSEVVIPLIDERGRAFAVFDGDSYDIAAFNEGDLMCIAELLRAAGLTPGTSLAQRL